MRDLKNLCLIGLMLAVAACASTPEPADDPTGEAKSGTRTILISIDGFRPDYLDRGVTPVMSAMAKEGARGVMQPSFPSKTFPNHYTLITGMTPDHHGVINNTMEDPLKPGQTFQIWDRKVAEDPDWWEGGSPLWVTAEQQGVKSATMFWPGSDYVIHGTRPGIYENFDQKLPDFARVDLVLSWLDQPPAEQPGFMTLYFDIVDTAGHLYGPESSKTTSATAQVDASIGRLMDGLEARGLAETTNIVIVSDHGMAPIADDRIASLDDLIAPEKVHVVFNGAFIGVMPEPAHKDEVEAALLGRQDHAECWRKSELPARFGYGTHPRVPAIICLADTGWRYESSGMTVWRNSGGDHGYDPADPLMHAIFIAHGPAFREGVTLKLFDNTSVYPLLAHLIGVEPVANDGNLKDMSRALK
ncbi:ectonucleotide pyrophosphatase/phosphodiesterase [Parvularcula marina]|uniref:alkaline phosphatase family protein n=1 Tax=Parvularcula marina TaxID=2292771 RepID=UPI003511E077